MKIYNMLIAAGEISQCSVGWLFLTYRACTGSRNPGKYRYLNFKTSIFQDWKVLENSKRSWKIPDFCKLKTLVIKCS